MKHGKKYGKGYVGNVLVFLLSIGLSVFVLIPTISVNAQQTVVSISPSTQNVSHYSNPEITVNVYVADVSDLYGFQFDVSYDKDVLNFNSIAKGPFLGNDGADTYWIPPGTSTPGLIDNAASTRQSTTASVSGSGNMAQIKFVIDPDLTTVPTTTQIKLSGVKLSDIYSHSLAPFGMNNGTVTIIICTGSETKPCGSSMGECQAGAQTCSNFQWESCQGGKGPTAEVCDNKDNDCDGNTDNVPDTTNPLTQACSVNRQGICAVGTETCTSGSWAGCPSPQQEICWDGIDQDCNGADSLCEGDLDGDGCIDISDVVMVATDFGKTSGFTNAESDIDGNGEVDVFDLVVVAKDYGSGPNC